MPGFIIIIFEGGGEVGRWGWWWLSITEVTDTVLSQNHPIIAQPLCKSAKQLSWTGSKNSFHLYCISVFILISS